MIYRSYHFESVLMIEIVFLAVIREVGTSILNVLVTKQAYTPIPILFLGMSHHWCDLWSF